MKRVLSGSAHVNRTGRSQRTSGNSKCRRGQRSATPDPRRWRPRLTHCALGSRQQNGNKDTKTTCCSCWHARVHVWLSGLNLALVRAYRWARVGDWLTIVGHRNLIQGQATVVRDTTCMFINIKVEILTVDSFRLDYHRCTDGTGRINQFSQQLLCCLHNLCRWHL